MAIRQVAQFILVTKMEEDLICKIYELLECDSEERNKLYKQLYEQEQNEKDPIKRGLMRMNRNSFYGNFPFNLKKD